MEMVESTGQQQTDCPFRLLYGNLSHNLTDSLNSSSTEKVWTRQAAERFSDESKVMKEELPPGPHAKLPQHLMTPGESDCCKQL